MRKYKRIGIVLLILNLLSINCFGKCPNLQTQHDMEFIESLNLVPEVSENYVSRRTMLYTFVNMVDSNYKKYDCTDNKFADIEKSDSAFKMADFALNYGLLTGRHLENGKIVADLDSYASWREVLIVSLRCLNISFNAHNNEEIFFWAQHLGLDEFSVKSENQVFKIIDILDEKIEFDDYCSFINKVLHTPYISFTYGGEVVKYRIDSFVENR